MKLASIKPADIVRCDVGGRVFHAFVLNASGGGLAIEPINRNVTYTRVKATQVTGHWRRSAGTTIGSVPRG